MSKSNLKYTGSALTAPYVVGEGNDKHVQIPVYLPDPSVVQAVNLALFLRRPLLLMGEPGCGKTMLAEAVAFELYGKNYKEHYFEWYVKSSTKAKEGIYSFDAIKRLRQTQIQGEGDMQRENKLSKEELEEYYIQKKYIRKGPLANAFDKGQSTGKPSVLLIDEIDKAEIDFPNDLLLELDKSRYHIVETDTFTDIEKANRPIIIITSNNEKELPSAFLRRCLYQYIRFPGEEQLKAILKGRFSEADAVLQEITIDAFIKIRERMSRNLSDKRISTGELIDWFKVIHHGEDVGLHTHGQPIEESLRNIIRDIPSGTVHIPYYQVLLKNWEAVRGLLVQNADHG